MRDYARPMFNHRHYATIASLLSQVQPGDTPDDVAKAFASVFRRDNSRFDWDRFIAAAQGKPTNRKDRR